MQVPEIEKVVEDALKGLSTHPQVWVTGPAGSGRNTVARALADRGSVLIEPPPLGDADAGAAFLLALGSAAGVGFPMLDAAGRPTADLRQQVRSRWADPRRPLVVRLRATVPLRAPVDEDDVLAARQRSALRLLDGVPVVWVADEGVHRDALGIQALPVPLPEHRIAFDPADWEGLPVAAEVAPRVRGRSCSPIVWRLAVGAAHLGCPPEVVANLVEASTAGAVQALVKELVERLPRSPLRSAVERLLLLRAPMPVPAALRYLSATGAAGAAARLSQAEVTYQERASENEAFLTRCLAYGDPVRVHPIVHAALAPRMLTWRSITTAHHRAAARVWEAQDGVADPRGLGLAALTPWIEKVHHLSLGGLATQARWQAQVKPSPEFYWARGKALSQARQNEKAAEVFRACTEAFPNDAYAHHYLGWNLDKAHAPAAPVRAALAAAVERDPNNPWWNARRIAHLIKTHRWPDAKRAWHLALERIDPSGEKAQSDAWLVAHLHFWVAKAWFDQQAWYEARNVLFAVAPDVIKRADTFPKRKLRQLQADIDFMAEQERQRFEAYLATRTEASWRRMQQVWWTMLQQVRDLPPPAASDGEVGPRFVWTRPGGSLSVELEEDDELSWAAHNHIRDVGGHGGAPLGLNGELLAWLRLMARHA